MTQLFRNIYIIATSGNNLNKRKHYMSHCISFILAMILSFGQSYGQSIENVDFTVRDNIVYIEYNKLARAETLFRK